VKEEEERAERSGANKRAGPQGGDTEREEGRKAKKHKAGGGELGGGA